MANLTKRKQKAGVILRVLKKLYPTITTELIYGNLWELLVAVALSAQTTDKQVNKVTEKLFKKYTSIEDFANASLEEMQQDLNTIGLYKNKAKNVIAAAQMVLADFDGEIPKSIKELVKIPGVGRKTANVIMGIGHGMPEGIAVDTHVTRIAVQLGITSHKTPIKIEKDLMAILPQDEWTHFTNRIIQYGRDHSPAHLKDITQTPLYLALKEENLC
jgi:endonuclease-3